MIKKHPLFLLLATGLLLSPLAHASLNQVSYAAPKAMDGETVDIRADHQIYNADQNKFDLSGNVIVTYQDYKITAKTADMKVDAAGKPNVASFFQRPLAKKIVSKVGEDRVQGDIIRVYLNDNRFGAEGNVDSYITTVAATPISIQSDTQQFDNLNNLVTAAGSVRVKYDGSDAFSQSATLRMDNGGKAERVIFTGGARLQKENSEVTGDKIIVMMGSGNLLAEKNVKTRVDLKDNKDGPPKVFIYSDYQQYDKASKKMLATGSVKILYGDYIVTGPKATFNMSDGQVDKIYMTGRSTIIDSTQQVTADKITITINPKNFDAVGNVKIQFKAKNQKAAPAAVAKPAPVAVPAKPAKGGKAGKPAVGKPVAAPAKPLPKDDVLDY